MGFQKHKTREEKAIRRAKYRVLKHLGYNIKFALRARDWRLTKIALLIQNKPDLPGSRN